MATSDIKHIVLTKIITLGKAATFKIPELTNGAGDKWMFRVRVDYVNTVLLVDAKTAAHYVRKIGGTKSVDSSEKIVIRDACWSIGDITRHSDLDMAGSTNGTLSTYNINFKNFTIASPLLCEALGIYASTTGIASLPVTGSHLLTPYRVLCDLASASCFVKPDGTVTDENMAHIFSPPTADGKTYSEVSEWQNVDVDAMDDLGYVNMHVLSANDSVVTFYPRTTYTIELKRVSTW